ncbi:MAG: response regulator transcription factor [Coriobacteriales bacterium]|jgi:DNA-binding response OmpR family regulator|nr:response regulator transcription factor [Coriobacteriales bacterium]
MSIDKETANSLNILIVEDDPLISQGLDFALGDAGYGITQANDLAQAKIAIASSSFDLILLDLTLPDGSGFELLDFLRARTDAAMICITAADDEATTVHAFNLGADDYVTKPFRLQELLARIKAVMRRRSGADDNTGDIVTVGASSDVTIDIKSAQVTLDGDNVDLTALEYRLLLYLAVNKGQILSRRQILDAMYADVGEYVSDNTLTVYIKRLRAKLGDDVITTVRGIGYRV